MDRFSLKIKNVIFNKKFMKSSFLSSEDIKISNEFKRNGYIIRNVADKLSLDFIRSKFIKLIKTNLLNKKHNYIWRNEREAVTKGYSS